ncbi:MAG: hypothetical protein F8N15_00435 [Methanobacterium sp.]|nr:hypothetical protein [Methanobacterium sp.]
MTILEYLAGYPLAFAMVVGGLWLAWTGWPHFWNIVFAIVLIGAGALYGYALFYVETTPNIFK